jgi:hypothetical protein
MNKKYKLKNKNDQKGIMEVKDVHAFTMILYWDRIAPFESTSFRNLEDFKSYVNRCDEFSKLEYLLYG